VRSLPLGKDIEYGLAGENGNNAKRKKDEGNFIEIEAKEVFAGKEKREGREDAAGKYAPAETNKRGAI